MGSGGGFRPALRRPIQPGIGLEEATLRRDLFPLITLLTLITGFLITLGAEMRTNRD